MKQKTKKAIKARFRVTATGKVKHNKPGRRHIMTKKSPKRKRQLRKAAIMGEVAIMKTYKMLLGQA